MASAKVAEAFSLTTMRTEAEALMRNIKQSVSVRDDLLRCRLGFGVGDIRLLAVDVHVSFVHGMIHALDGDKTVLKNA